MNEKAANVVFAGSILLLAISILLGLYVISGAKAHAKRVQTRHGIVNALEAEAARAEIYDNWQQKLATTPADTDSLLTLFPGADVITDEHSDGRANWRVRRVALRLNNSPAKTIPTLAEVRALPHPWRTASLTYEIKSEGDLCLVAVFETLTR